MLPSTLRSGIIYADVGSVILAPVLMRSSSDHASTLPGLSLTFRISVNGSTLTQTTLSYVDSNSGWYCVTIPNTYTQAAGTVLVTVTGSGADPAFIKCSVSGNKFDELPNPLSSSMSFGSRITQRLLTILKFIGLNN